MHLLAIIDLPEMDFAGRDACQILEAFSSDNSTSEQEKIRSFCEEDDVSQILGLFGKKNTFLLLCPLHILNRLLFRLFNFEKGFSLIFLSFLFFIFDVFVQLLISRFYFTILDIVFYFMVLPINHIVFCFFLSSVLHFFAFVFDISLLARNLLPIFSSFNFLSF